MNRLHKAVEQNHGRTLLGAALYFYDPVFLEVAAHLGYQAIWIEMEHAPITFAEAADLCRMASGSGMLTLIRIPDSRRENILKAAECGPDIIDVAMVEEVDQMHQMLEYGRFAPHGGRGCFGVSRAVGYGVGNCSQRYPATVNRELCLMAQVETAKAVKNLDQLAVIPGIDLFVGPADLAASLGHPGETLHPTVLEASARIVQAARGTASASPRRAVPRISSSGSTRRSTCFSAPTISPASSGVPHSHWTRRGRLFLRWLKRPSFPVQPRATTLGTWLMPPRTRPRGDEVTKGAHMCITHRRAVLRMPGVAWILIPLLLTPGLRAQPGAPRTDGPGAAVLKPADYAHYVEMFHQQEREATGKLDEGAGGEDTWPWMQREIPWFDSSDKQFEEMYYFRWYAWKKHLVQTAHGYLITEWLPKPDLADYGALPDAAPFHIAEARWLREPAIAEDDARYWFSPAVDSHKYSDDLAATVRDLTLANGDSALGASLLPAMKANYKLWEDTQQDSNGLFWSIDTRDAMEKSISGDGYRPTLNSYMYGDARAIAKIAAAAGDQATAAAFNRKADTLHTLIETNLWNPKDQFYEVMSPAADSGIRQQKKFIDPGTTMQLAGVRELIGYIPWMFDIPSAPHAVAWQQLFDAQGFDGKFGATTAERRSPRFRFTSSDQCTWNGPGLALRHDPDSARPGRLSRHPAHGDESSQPLRMAAYPRACRLLQALLPLRARPALHPAQWPRHRLD